MYPSPLLIGLEEGSCIELHPLTPPVNKKLHRLSFKEPVLPPVSCMIILSICVITTYVCWQILTNLLSMQYLKEMLDDDGAIETEYHVS